MADQQKYKIVEVPETPEQYANQFISAGFDGSSIAITLGTARFVPTRMGESPAGSGQPEVFVTTRLMMSVASCMEMMRQLQGMMDQLGIKQSGQAGGGGGQQPAGWSSGVGK